jgi:transcription elongation factor B subunit 1
MRIIFYHRNTFIDLSNNWLSCINDRHSSRLHNDQNSKERHEFLVAREVVMAAGTIRMMLTGPGTWAETKSKVPTIIFEEISSPVLEKVIQYFHYKKRYDGAPPPLPKFDIDLDTIVPLLMAANFLDT